MAASGSSRPSATLIALAALLAVIAIAADPVSASQLNYFTAEDCSGGIILSCSNRQRCAVPDGAVSYQFRQDPGFPAYIYDNRYCSGTINGIIAWDVDCSRGISFKCAFVTDSPSI